MLIILIFQLWLNADTFQNMWSISRVYMRRVESQAKRSIREVELSRFTYTALYRDDVKRYHQFVEQLLVLDPTSIHSAAILRKNALQYFVWSKRWCRQLKNNTAAEEGGIDKIRKQISWVS